MSILCQNDQAKSSCLFTEVKSVPFSQPFVKSKCKQDEFCLNLSFFFNLKTAYNAPHSGQFVYHHLVYRVLKFPKNARISEKNTEF